MARVIPSYQIDIGAYKDEIYNGFDDILSSGVLVLGKNTKSFEEMFAKYHGKRRAITVNSDTAALDCSLTMIGIKDEPVLIPQMGFFGVVNVVLKLGGIPILVDVTVNNGIMPTWEQWSEAVDFVFKRFGRYPKVAMFVYSGGMAGSDSAECINRLRRQGIKIVEDCAHCAGAKYREGARIGNLGDFSTWSFYATKLLHSGEGGIIATDDEATADEMENYRAYGKKCSDGVFVESASDKGYNWRMTEFQAVILNVMWSHLPELLEKRMAIAKVYDVVFDFEGGKGSFIGETCFGAPYKLVPVNGGTVNMYRYMVMVPGMSFEDNVFLYKWLANQDPAIKLQEKCNHLPLSYMAPYQSNPRVIPVNRSCPEAARFSKEHICLPIYPRLSVEDACYIRDAVVLGIEETRKQARK